MLPMVRVEKDYKFDGPNGPASLLDMFEGRTQLIIQHFMFDPSWEDGCSSCTASSDELSDGLLRHLYARDTTFAVSRALRSTSSSATSRSEAGHFRGTRRSAATSTTTSTSASMHRWRRSSSTSAGRRAEGARPRVDARRAHASSPGTARFLAVDGEVFHTYSVYARGTEWLGGSYAFLDLTALGRQEDWEEPKGRSDNVRGAVPDFSS